MSRFIDFKSGDQVLLKDNPSLFSNALGLKGLTGIVYRKHDSILGGYLVFFPEKPRLTENLYEDYKNDPMWSLCYLISGSDLNLFEDPKKE